VLKYAADALRDFGRFGAYPYREFDIVETPTTARGIEYPGVIVINQGLYKDPGNRGPFEVTAVHEVAHQWWYGVVGNDQVNYPWVDESLTQYAAVIYEEDLHGSAVSQAILREYMEALYGMAKKAGHDAAVNQPVSAFNEADYTAIVYGKGPLFFDAIRKKMGDAGFFRFLSAYYAKYRYKVAFPEDILATAQAACTCSLEAEYRLWITSPAK
jgi:aminopeptidase N